MSLRANWSGYQELRPGGVLDDYVSAVWVRSAGGDREDGTHFREICDGWMNLICRTGSPAAAVGLMSDALLRRSQQAQADQMIAEAITRLATELEISAVWRSMGISEWSFRRRFIAGVGIGPKTLQTLLRFQRLLGRAQRAVAAGRPVMAVPFKTVDRSRP